MRHFHYYFSNPLLIPEGYGEPGLDIRQAQPPTDRLTDAGRLVVTMEYDWVDVNQFNRNIDWFSGKNGDFGSGPFVR